MTRDGADGLEIEVSASGSGTCITVRGELDLATVPLVQRRFEEAVTDGAARVTLDLVGVTFLDARGVGFLASVAHREVEVSMRVSARVRRLLEITDLDTSLPLD